MLGSGPGVGDGPHRCEDRHVPLLGAGGGPRIFWGAVGSRSDGCGGPRGWRDWMVRVAFGEAKWILFVRLSYALPQPLDHIYRIDF